MYTTNIDRRILFGKANKKFYNISTDSPSRNNYNQFFRHIINILSAVKLIILLFRKTTEEMNESCTSITENEKQTKSQIQIRDYFFHFQLQYNKYKINKNQLEKKTCLLQSIYFFSKNFHVHHKETKP